MQIISIKPKKTPKIALKQLKKRRFVSRGTNVDNFFVSRETFFKFILDFIIVSRETPYIQNVDNFLIFSNKILLTKKVFLINCLS